MGVVKAVPEDQFLVGVHTFVAIAPFTFAANSFLVRPFCGAARASWLL